MGSQNTRAVAATGILLMAVNVLIDPLRDEKQYI